jgi:hypothetical protein
VDASIYDLVLPSELIEKFRDIPIEPLQQAAVSFPIRARFQV